MLDVVNMGVVNAGPEGNFAKAGPDTGSGVAYPHANRRHSQPYFIT
jgi:hypothetical protein